MKILYSRTQFWFNLTAGGSVSHTAGVLHGFSRHADVEIISNNRLYGVDAIPCTVIEPLFSKEVVYNLQFAPALTRKIRSFKPDFVYHRYSGPSIATALVCRRTNTPLVLEFNGSDVWVFRYWTSRNSKSRIQNLFHRLKQALVRPVLEYNERLNLKAAYLITVVSEPLRASLVECGIPPERILVNPNATDPGKFKPSPPDVRDALKKKLGIPEGRTIIGFSGTFGRWHGIPDLAEAIVRLNADPSLESRIFFVLFGDGELRPLIEERTAKFSNVLFTGTIDYGVIQDYLSVCDILVSPHGKTPDGREFFGSPTKLFEYMAMGKGIVASRLGQIGELLEDGRTAVLVEPGDVDDLVRGISRLVNNPAEAEQLGSNAREVVLRNHTWDRHAENIIRTFEGLQKSGERE